MTPQFTPYYVSPQVPLSYYALVFLHSTFNYDCNLFKGLNNNRIRILPIFISGVAAKGLTFEFQIMIIMRNYILCIQVLSHTCCLNSISLLL